MQANIRLVTVQGEQQGRDADLDHVQQFEVETNAGHRSSSRVRALLLVRRRTGMCSAQRMAAR
ncbi:hypothetical protein DEJ27_16485 [Curtobacterium sp. MCPF17_018]|nr:hypothetical protein DEJ27_16485 [Curtobacterium sp. MCPF17_018]